MNIISAVASHNQADVALAFDRVAGTRNRRREVLTEG
jgi:hypothetical protein